jgi:hypothetical protein
MPGSEPRHFSFLVEGRQDPRPELLASLSRLIGGNGSVIAYNKSFEENMLVDLGNAFPGYVGWTANVVSKLVGLIVPFRRFHYYHPAQKGSASLKSVLPAVTGLSYEEMPIAGGDDASLAFFDHHLWGCVGRRGGKSEREIACLLRSGYRGDG